MTKAGLFHISTKGDFQLWVVEHSPQHALGQRPSDFFTRELIHQNDAFQATKVLR